MLKVMGCIQNEHDLRLVAISVVICALGCFTTVTLMARAGETADRLAGRWTALAAILFGCSVWSLHFVAMLAFLPAATMAYNVERTALSMLLAASGALGALLVLRRGSVAAPATVVLSGALLGLGIAAMHYMGIAAMAFSGFLTFDRTYVAVSLGVSVVFATVALARARDLRTIGHRLEVAGWLSLAVCGLHFTGMAALTVAPGTAETTGAVLGSSTLAVAVGAVSVAILLASLVAAMVEQHFSQRVLQDLNRMRLMSNLAHEVVFIHSGGIVREVNSAGERLFRAEASSLIGRSVLSLFTESSSPALGRRERCAPQDRQPEETEIRTEDGTAVSVEISCQPIEYLGEHATAVALRDLTKSKRDEARIRHLARHDALTNLPNRYNLQERLDVALDAAAEQGSALAVVYIDLDRFKPVNDLLGHAAGDTLLVQASRRIAAEIQAPDTLARVGGDEFVMVLTSEPQPERASALGSRIIEALRRPFLIEGHRIEIGASIGVALYPDDGIDADALMRAADAAMYRAKEEGRGALRFYEPAMNAQHQARLQLQQELAGAVARDELVLHYQPIVNAATGEVETFEALIRWNHPTRGMVPPVEFIPLAEETGLIDPIGRWVIDTACREAAGWEHPWRVSVNVSPIQFRQSDVCAAIAGALQASRLAPARVVVEVTEGVLIADAGKAVAILNRMRGMGVRIALDDFGTGYSSLSYLQLFKFDKFKIDKSFVTKLGQSDDALTITRTIVNLGHNLGLHVTAEGVETPTQLKILQDLGCDQIQGYLVARPGPVEAFTPRDRIRTIALFGQDRLRLSA